MHVIFMGTPDFAVEILNAVLEAGHEISLVVTQPDKPKGRSKTLYASPVKEYASARGLCIYQPRRIREAESIAYLKEHQPDMIVTAAFGQILSREILEMPKYGCINIHASLLPKYRGASPVQWAVINGDQISGVTAMRMDEGIDTGDIIAKTEVALEKDETGESLFGRLAKAGAELCVRTMDSVEKGAAVYTKQEESDAVYVGVIRKEMGNINWNQTAVEIERLIRGLAPWPGTYTKLNGKILKIWRASVEPNGNGIDAGRIVSVTKKECKVQTKDGILSLLEVQLEGKKRMDIETFLRGHDVKKDTILQM